MNRAPQGPLAKLAKAARLNAEASKLQAEAAEELARGWTPDPPPTNPTEPPKPVLTEMDRARARAGLRRAGGRVA